MPEWFIVIDLGGTQIRAARCLATGEMAGRVVVPTHAVEGREAVLARIQEAVRQVWPDGEKVLAISAATPGPVDSRRGIVLFAPNLPGWQDVPLRDWLADVSGVPAFLGNDASVAALGEQRFGAGRGVDDLVYLTIGTGVGGGIILDGRLFEGGLGFGGEVGHMAVEADGPPCSCGNVGCLEVFASGSAIARAARDALIAGAASRLSEGLEGDPSRITARDVAEAAQAGDALANEIMGRAGFYIGVAIVNLMFLLNPSLFVIGGSVSKAGDLILEPAREAVRRRAPRVYSESATIRLASLADDAGLLGALALARDNLESVRVGSPG